MEVDSLMEHQRLWVEGLNRGDVSSADAAFAPDCVVHFTGFAEPIRGLGPWKGFTGRRLSIDGLIIDRVVGGKVQERWEQLDTSLMLQQLGLK